MQNGRVVLDDIDLSREYLEGLQKIYIVACGSAHYVGCLGKYVLEKTCRVPVEPIMASEFRYSDPVLCGRTLVIIISQSGETADTLAALREAKRRGARTLAIVNVVGSAIAKAADQVIYTWAGPEIAVATTKAYSTQVSVMYLLALYISQQLGTCPRRNMTPSCNRCCSCRNWCNPRCRRRKLPPFSGMPPACLTIGMCSSLAAIWIAPPAWRAA